VAAGSGLSRAVLVLPLAEVIDDAAGFAHPVGAAGRGVAHDAAGERRGGLVEPPRCPPGAGVPVPGPLQPAREVMTRMARMMARCALSFGMWRTRRR
jgi:hypothetical protein